jgi:hypothetical protein
MIKSPNRICILETRSNWYPIRSKCPLDRAKATKAPTPTASKTSPLKAVRVMTGTNPLHPRPNFEVGNTKFQRWHTDAPLYEREPAHFTASHAVKRPVGPDLTVNWEGGRGLSAKVQPGQTAVLQQRAILHEPWSEEAKTMAEHGRAERAPLPYVRIENCRGGRDGLGACGAGGGSSRAWDAGMGAGVYQGCEGGDYGSNLKYKTSVADKVRYACV